MTSRAIHFLVIAMVGVLFLTGPLPAYGECSKARVKQLSKKGNTVAAISRTCDMQRDEVQSILKDSEEEDDSKRSRGTPVGECGCWGPIQPGYRQPHEECKSGYARPQMCNAMCPMGGYAWRGVCT